MLSLLIISKEGSVWIGLTLLWMVCIVEEIEVAATSFLEHFNLLICVNSFVLAEVLQWVTLKRICGSRLVTFSTVVIDSLSNNCVFDTGYLEQKAKEIHKDRSRVEQ